MIAITDRDHARREIAAAGLTSFNVTDEQILLLMGCLRKVFMVAPNYQGTMRLKSRKVTRFLEMKTNSWERRECVSFNTDGFIGFAGWADDKNIQPILKAVGMWLDCLKGGE